MTQRVIPIRSRHLLDSAKGQPCDLRIPGVCNHDPETTVSCHVPDEAFGMGVKANDFATFHGCAACHQWLDRREWLGRMDREDVIWHVLRAFLRTLRNRIERGYLAIKLDAAKTLVVKPRKPPAQRKPIQQRNEWPVGRKIPTRQKEKAS